MEPITLGEIKKYCEENGINLSTDKKDPLTVGNIQYYGDVKAEVYFNYYLMHSTEIEEWRKNRNQYANVDTESDEKSL